MCGIAGMVGPTGETVDAADVRRMCRTIVHRGPDDEGTYVQGQVGLGMRRLSIIDLSGGRQPIHNEDKSIWIVFNGEIYNFPELRRDLEARGHQFYTHTDTEVIVHLYEEMGSDCVKKLRGMFAVALYDFNNRTLLLARDRLGKKPLYYALHQGRLLFGSEIKALLAVAPELAEVSPEGILQFFFPTRILPSRESPSCRPATLRNIKMVRSVFVSTGTFLRTATTILVQKKLASKNWRAGLKKQYEFA